jgi:hypothetical protein
MLPHPLDRCSMSGLMPPLATFPSLQTTAQTGRRGGVTPRTWSWSSLWARTMSPFTQLFFQPHCWARRCVHDLLYRLGAAAITQGTLHKAPCPVLAWQGLRVTPKCTLKKCMLFVEGGMDHDAQYFRDGVLELRGWKVQQVTRGR